MAAFALCCLNVVKHEHGRRLSSKRCQFCSRTVREETRLCLLSHQRILAANRYCRPIRLQTTAYNAALSLTVFC